MSSRKTLGAGSAVLLACLGGFWGCGSDGEPSSNVGGGGEAGLDADAAAEGVERADAADAAGKDSSAGEFDVVQDSSAETSDGDGASGPQYGHRGLVALPRPGGPIYLGWRLLLFDDSSTSFHVYRKENNEVSFSRIDASGVSGTTNYVDETAVVGSSYSYLVRAVSQAVEGPDSEIAKAIASAQGSMAINIPTQAEAPIERLVPGDLNGDGIFDFVYAWPETRPAPVEFAYHLGAVLSDGTQLWSQFLGEGTAGWLEGSPFTVWDVDQDGRDDIILRTSNGSTWDDYSDEQLTILEGLTGEVKKQTKFPGKVNWDQNDNLRDYLGIAFLHHTTPFIVVGRGTYQNIRVVAYDLSLQQLWEVSYATGDQGPAAHAFEVADLDEDGNDELIWGDVIIDENGKIVWKAPNLPYNGHPDILWCADVRPDLPGLEYVIGNESWNEQASDLVGLALYAADGTRLWFDNNKQHLHIGYMHDISSAHDGMEMYITGSVTKDGELTDGLHNAKGEVILADPEQQWYGYAPVLWNDNLPALLYSNGRFVDFDSNTTKLDLGSNPSTYRGPNIADIVGDFREEVIRLGAGGLSVEVLSNSATASTRKVTGVLDRKARLATTRWGSQYGRQVFRSERFFTPQSAP